MNPDTLMASAITEIGLISYRSVKAEGRGPLPSELLSVIGLWGALSLFSGPAPEATALIGWGLVIATALNLFGGPTTPTTPLATAPKTKAGK